MSDAKYTVINKCFDGVSLNGLTIQNSEGNKKLVKMEDMIKLTRSGKISNTRPVLNTNNGLYTLSVNGGYESLDTVYKNSNLKLTLLCRIMSADKKCIGYKARDDSGKTYKLSSPKVWELAYNKNIVGVEAKTIGNYKALVSSEMGLIETLPKIDD